MNMHFPCARRRPLQPSPPPVRRETFEEVAAVEQQDPASLRENNDNAIREMGAVQAVCLGASNNRIHKSLAAGTKER